MHNLRSLKLSMMTPSTPSGDAAVASDKNTLRNLLLSIWASRGFVCIVTQLITVAAAAYAFLAQPIYQSSTQMLPPPASSLASYNAANLLVGIDTSTTPQDEPAQEAEESQLTPDGAYETFLRHLTSNSLRMQFFESTYLPTYAVANSRSEKDALWKRMEDDIVVTRPAKDSEVASLTVEGNDPQLIAQWANQYTQLALSAAHKELIKNLSSAVQVAQQINAGQIQAVRTVAASSRASRLARLQDALHIAEDIGLESPQHSGNLITVDSDDNDYLRGARAIRAEIAQLQARTDDDAYIDELPELMRINTLLSTIDTNPNSLQVAVIDRPARAADAPIKPNKALTLAVGLMLGGILGVFAALAKSLFGRPQPTGLRPKKRLCALSTHKAD